MKKRVLIEALREQREQQQARIDALNELVERYKRRHDESENTEELESARHDLSIANGKLAARELLCADLNRRLAEQAEQLRTDVALDGVREIRELREQLRAARAEATNAEFKVMELELDVRRMRRAAGWKGEKQRMVAEMERPGATLESLAAEARSRMGL